MSRVTAGRDAPRRIAAAIAALAALAGLGLLASADAPAKKGKPKGKVKVTIRAGSDADVLAADAIPVTVRARGKATKVRLSARRKRLKHLTKPRAVKATRKPKRIRLRLNARGRQVVLGCGTRALTVDARYRKQGRKRKGAKKRGKGKRARVKTTRKLGVAPGACASDVVNLPLHVEAPNAERCDPIDLSNCLAPFPNDYLTVADPTSGSGRRVAVDPASALTNSNGDSAFSPEFNRNDGFSPNNIIVTRVPGIETPEAFKANEIVSQLDIGRYDDPGQRVVLIDAVSGKRVPIWAELDMVPGTPNPHNNDVVQGSADDRMLMIHPAVSLDPGRRYIVALRDLHALGGSPLSPNAVFGAYRDAVPTDNAAVEARRPKMEQIFAELGAAGIGRGDLYLAWDFTVASDSDLSKRLLAMRDDAFAQLGDTDLDDDQIDGASPSVTITGEANYDLCSVDATPECETDGVGGFSGTSQSDYAFKKVTGTIEVPCYMNAPGARYNPGDPGTPCASGSRLHYAAGAEVPSQNGGATWQAPFTCTIPRTAKGSPTMATGKPAVAFGHGLLQNHRIPESVALFPAQLEGVVCSTDWIGLSGTDAITGAVLPDGDLAGHLLNMMFTQKDLSLFSALPDRSQQGYVNMLYLARAMAHAGGLGSEPELQSAGVPAIDVDQNAVSDDLAYYGVSLGGIFGGATTAVAPDWRRAVLSVPGIGFTTLLTRSTQFNQFLPLVYGAYPDPLGRAVGMSMLQLVWDRGEPSAYVEHLTGDPYPNTPPHEVMIHEAFGDHQVANVQTETLARTLDADHRRPGVDPARLDDVGYLFTELADVTPFWGLDTVGSGALNSPGGFDPGSGAVMYTFDTGAISDSDPGPGFDFVGTTPNPDWDIAPVSRDNAAGVPNAGLDPHEPAATSPAAQQAAIPFLLGQGYYDPCVSGAPSPATMPPWPVPYTGAPAPCTAPPVHSPGQGL